MDEITVGQIHCFRVSYNICEIIFPNQRGGGRTELARHYGINMAWSSAEDLT